MTMAAIAPSLNLVPPAAGGAEEAADEASIGVYNGRESTIIWRGTSNCWLPNLKFSYRL